METYSKFKKKRILNHTLSHSSLAIGFFDGVHLGHQQIFKNLIESSPISYIITFQQHPFNVLNPDLPPTKLISTHAQKINLIKKYANPNYLYTLKFSKILSNMTYIQFFHWIRQYIPFKKLILGYDSSFGKNRKGSLSELIKLSKKLSFEIENIPALTINNQIISSTYIRYLIRIGNLSLAKKFLGRTYSILGKVSKGKQRATQYFKIPTANLYNINELELPPLGVYAVTVKYKKSSYQGIANLGLSPTFQKDQNKLKLEVHIFNLSKNIYDEKIEVFFHFLLRKEKTFNSIKELKHQINLDILKCKKLFLKLNYEEII